MSDYDKSTCPVCFTKMRNIKKVLTCPECGYKYCDHNRDLQNMFDTNHTHEPNYTTYTRDTTYTNNTTSRQNTAPRTSANAKNLSNTYSSSGKTTYTNTSSGKTTYSNSGSGQKSSNKNVGKIIKIIVIIYLLLTFCPVGCGLLFTAISTIGEIADADTSPEIHISSDLWDEESAESLDADTLLAEMDSEAPVDLEGGDGEFVPELIKHIFNADSVDDVTYEDISTVYYLEIYSYDEDNSYVYYYTNNGDSGNFEYEGSDINTSDLKTFFALEYLYSSDISYEENDLQDMPLLTTLSCKNTPAELTRIVSPEQIDDLTLVLPEGTSSLDGLEEFTALNWLEIDAYDADITDASIIAEIPELYYLDYSDSGSLTDYSFLSQMPALEYLYLCAPGLTDISFVEDLPELRTLAFGEIPGVTDLSPLSSVASTIKSLSLSYCPGITDFNVISDLTGLEYLAIDNCTLDHLEFAKDLENLISLSIIKTNVTSLDSVKDLPKLQYIYTYGTSIDDYAGLKDIVYGY